MTGIDQAESCCAPLPVVVVGMDVGQILRRHQMWLPG